MENYQTMVEDRFFWQSIKVTLYYLLNVPLNVVLGLLLALLLNQKVKGLSVFRTIFFFAKRSLRRRGFVVVDVDL